MSALAKPFAPAEMYVPNISVAEPPCDHVTLDLMDWVQSTYTTHVQNALHAFKPPSNDGFCGRIGQLTSHGITFGSPLGIPETTDLSSIEAYVHDSNREYLRLFQEVDLSITRLREQSQTISLLEQLNAEKSKQERQLSSDALIRFRLAHRDALSFSSALTHVPIPNSIATAEDGEVVFEWYGTHQHVVVSMDGSGEYGYSYEVDGKIVAGLDEGICGRDVPEDLRRYLETLAQTRD